MLRSPNPWRTFAGAEASRCPLRLTRSSLAVMPKKDFHAPLMSTSPPLRSTIGPVQPRRISPAPTRPQAVGQPVPRAKVQQTIAPGQPVPAGRQKDKFVPLPEEDEEQSLPTPSLFEDLPSHLELNSKGRITFYCIAENLDRNKLDELLKSVYPMTSIKSYPDVFYVEYLKGDQYNPGGDIFFFDYGVVACWGLTESQEKTIVHGIARQVVIQPLPDNEVESDKFQFNYSAIEKPHIQNDVVTLHRRFAQDHKMKLAISYALAQSTKLSVYEKRVVDIVLETKNLPESLAESGEINISGVEIAKLIGKVFLQKSAVNLLSSVLDTPEFFWHEPDSFQALYTRITEYLELTTRVEVLNSRFSVLQEMLDMLRDHENNHHNARLEWIVIWLIVVEVIVGVFELLGLFGLVGKDV